jgi:Asp-tRNA(Asn)/Glu-tRNA(Gln) amidotransferase A subunit family amidase
VQATDLFEAAIDRIEERNPGANAVVHKRYDVARIEAGGRLPIGSIRSLHAGWALRVSDIARHVADRTYAFVPFTPIFNATGQPAMSVPLHWTDTGLPIGTHLVGRFGDEGTLFRLAGQLERARPWTDRRPPLPSR